MINNLESQSKAELIKIIEIQQEEYKKMQAEVEEFRVYLQQAVENVSGCGDCVLLPMEVWEGITNVFYNHESISLEAHNLTQQAKGRRAGVSYALNMYCTHMSPKEFPPIADYYANQLLERAKGSE